MTVPRNGHCGGSGVITLGELLVSAGWISTGTLAPAVAQLPVRGLSLDSRQLSAGEVFIALRGSRVDGRQYMAQAARAGAVAILAESDLPPADESASTLVTGCSALEGECSVIGGCPVIEVPRLAWRLSALAGQFYGSPSHHLNVVGITGTNGKTTCAHLLAQLETRLLGRPAASLGTLGYGLATDTVLTETGMTTPDAIGTQRILAQLLRRGAATVAMEVSSHSLSQGRVAGIKFDGAVFTNLTRDHLDYHGDMERYAQAKQTLFEWPGLNHAVINIDDDYGRQFSRRVSGSARLWTYAIDRREADVHIRELRFHQAGFEARVVSPWGEGRIHSGLLGEFNLRNLLAVIAVACARGADFASVLPQVSALKPVAGRMERVREGGDITVVVDYAHTPDALQQALLALQHHSAGKLWCVFGCGGDRDGGKRLMMGAIAEKFAGKVVITSDNPRSEEPLSIINDILAGIEKPEAVVVEADRAAAIAGVIGAAQPGDCILIAGKGHEDYQLIGDRRFAFCDKTHACNALRQRTEDRKQRTEDRGQRTESQRRE